MKQRKMKQSIQRLVLFIWLVSFALISEACRFTVREIGFSLLSPTEYSLVVVDDAVDFSAPAIQQLTARLKSSNVRLVLLNSQVDASHPLLQRAQSEGVTFPNAVLFGPEERFCPLFEGRPYSLQALSQTVDKQILSSPLREQILSDVSRTFAYVIQIAGKYTNENQQVQRRIKDDCLRVNDIMPLMPKSVEKAPQILRLDDKSAQAERVLLWSLGLDSVPEHPQTVIVYGRGRYMGQPLTTHEVSNGLVYKYLAMVGADCECNLDRAWMLGTQLPMRWNKETRQKLAESLDFDVDNPLILAEMSRILSKEEPGGNATVSYTPETIDLDEVFDSESIRNVGEVGEEDKSSTAKMLWITLGGLLVVAAFISIYILKRRREE